VDKIFKYKDMDFFHRKILIIFAPCVGKTLCEKIYGEKN